MSIPQANVSEPAARKGSGSGTHMLSCQSPRRASAAGSAARERASETGSAARDTEGGTHMLSCHPQATVSGAGSVATIQRGELTSCHVNPPGERQRADSAAWDPEGGTHLLSCQPPKEKISEPAAQQGIRKRELTCCHVNPTGERQRASSGKMIRSGNSLSAMPLPRRMSAGQRLGEGFGRGAHFLSNGAARPMSARRDRCKGPGWAQLTGCHV